MIPSGIRGVSEDRRDPRLGKIRLGVQKPNKSGRGTHPEMSPYFVFDTDTASGALLQQMFGDQCTEIPIAAPSDDINEFARRNLEMWGAGTLKCRGNGEVAEALSLPAEHAKYMVQVQQAAGQIVAPHAALWSSTSRAGNADPNAPQPERMPIPCLGLGYDGAPACPKFASNDCKATMHLQVIVRGFPGLGVFQIDTGSVVNIQRIDDFLTYLGRYTGGRYAMVPLVMRLEPYEMRGRTFYGLVFAVDFAAMQGGGLSALPQVASLSITERVTRYLPAETATAPAAALLAAPVSEYDEAPDDVIDVVAEPVFEPAEVADELQPPEPLEVADYVDPDDDALPFPEVPHFTTPGDLLTWALREHGMNKAQVLRLCGLQDTVGLLQFGLDAAAVAVADAAMKAGARA